MTNEYAKQKLIVAGQVLVNEGQDDFTRGHISVRVPDDPQLFFMKPHSVGLDEITLNNILTIDLAGNVVAGTSRQGYSQPGALFYESVGLYDDTINLIRTPEMGAGVAKALGSKRAVLLKNHGIAVAGGTIEEVIVSALMLENAARIQMIVEAGANPGSEFPRADLEQLQRDIG